MLKVSRIRTAIFLHYFFDELYHMTQDMHDEIPEADEDGLFEHYRITADPKQTLLRIDKFLIARLPNISRNRVQAAAKDGFIKVGGETVRSNYKVHPHDEIVISLPNPPRNEEVLPENLDLNIIYEDDELLIVNKPAVMVVHTAYNNSTGTLVNGLVYHMKDLPTHRNGEIRPGLVHRIDKDTSGLLVIAKTEESMTHLAKQFYDHTVERTYYAIAWGRLKEEKSTIVGNVGRSLKNRMVMSVFPDGEFGKHAVTHYEVLEDLSYVSLVKCNLETGRTHQIRAHFKHLGNPLFNDATYGGDRIIVGQQFTKYKQFVNNVFKVLPRQALHAKTLGFVHPKTGEHMQFDSELPKDFVDGLEKWRKYISHR